MAHCLQLHTRAWTDRASLADLYGRCRGYLTWPGVPHVLRRETERIIMKTGEVTHAGTYAITSLRATDRSPAGLAHLWQEHWTIEHRVQYVRDVTLGEATHQMHTGHAPHACATIRNALLNLLRRDGWTNMAAAFRHYHGSVHDALQCIGYPLPGL